MQKLKALLGNLALLFFSLAVALLAMELLLPHLKVFSIEEAVYQVRRPVVQFSYGVSDPDLHYTLEKNLQNIRLNYPGKLDYTVSTNSQGFRGGEWDLSPQRRNVLLLGDSFAFGWGVDFEESVGRRLEKELHKIDRNFQVINLAQSGYSIKEVVRSLEIFKEKLHPEAVVYAFCPNDTESMSSKDAAGEYHIEYQPAPDEAESFAEMRLRNREGYWGWDKMRKGSYLHAFYARFVRPLISRRIRSSLQVDQPPPGYDFPPPLTAGTEPPSTPETRFMTYCLERLAKAAGGQLFLIPTSDKSILFRRDNEKNLRWVLAKFSAGSSTTHFLDFESAVRLTPDGRKYYLLFDDHWSPAGHALAAEMLAGKMLPELQSRPASAVGEAPGLSPGRP